jgi:hypothetical protein
VFLWALKNEEMPVPVQGVLYESTLQLYEVHAAGLEFLHSQKVDSTFRSHIFRHSVSPSETKLLSEPSWIYKIFPVRDDYCMRFGLIALVFSYGFPFFRLNLGRMRKTGMHYQHI